MFQSFVYLVGDMIFLSHILGLGGHFGRRGKNCLFCEVQWDKLFQKNPCTLRNLNRLYRMAHVLQPGTSFPFTCPGCNVTFTCQSDLDAEQAPQDPTSYELTHASSAWHRVPLIDVEPTHIVLCCLHLVLSLTKTLFKKRVMWMIHTDDQACRLNAFLANIGICIPKQGKVGDSLGKDQTGRIRFTGPDCFALLRNFDGVVAEVMRGAPNITGLQEWANET